MDKKRKILIFSILTVMILAVGSIAAYYWYENANYVTTEDAKVKGDLVKAAPQITAKLVELNIKEGEVVRKNDILARQDLMGVEDSKIETTVIRAPISGIVVKKQGTVGEVASAGQAVATIVDTNQLYVEANIEETMLSKLKLGQKVDITIDQYGGQKFEGKVSSIGQATAATFSLLPSSSSGTFTKVVQKVPVKIEMNMSDLKLLPGTNAVVKIHIRA